MALFDQNFVPIGYVWEFPRHIFDLAGRDALLYRVGIKDYSYSNDNSLPLRTYDVTLQYIDELGIALSFLPIELVINSEGGLTEIPATIQIDESLGTLTLPNVSPALRFDIELLAPVELKGDSYVPILAANGDIAPYQLNLNGLSLSADTDGNVSFDFGVNGAGVRLKPLMLGNTGIVIESDLISLHLDQNAAPPQGQATGFTGVFIEEARIILPESLRSAVPSRVTIEDCYIGKGGFTGAVSASWTNPYQGTILGLDFELEFFEIELNQNSISEFSIKGKLTLPFFDEPVNVELGLDMGGNISIKLAATSPNGIYTLSKPGVLTAQLESLAFEIEDGDFKVIVSGELTPDIGGFNWPAFRVDDLAIDSDGNVSLEGGWLNLPKQYALDFNGFMLEITKIGFGKTSDGGKYIGASGGLTLVKNLQAGASVEGLRVIWYDDGRPSRITFDGVGVEFEIPDVLQFKGAVSYRDLGSTKRFDGSIEVNLMALGIVVDAKIVIGRKLDPGTGKEFSFFALYLSADFGAGIPLWATGLSLYGVSGMFAMNMEPDKRSDERWYGIGANDGWYKRPNIGVTDINNKWRPEDSSMGFGAGVTLGTAPDNGFLVNARFMLVLIFPGPIIMLEGKANMLKKRAALDDEPIFRALAVLDNREESFLVGVDAQYLYGKDGQIIDIRAGAEAFYSFRDPKAWHLYLGVRDPLEQRIRASVIYRFFEANAYFMLDSEQLAMGAFMGYDKRWEFGPLAVMLEAWIEGNAVLSWSPSYLSADFWLHGLVGLSVFGFDVVLSRDAKVQLGVFDPLHILLSFDVGIKLPWPLKDIKVTIKVEWGPKGDAPKLPIPLKELAIEHFKVSATWPLPRLAPGGGGERLLLPDYEDGDGMYTATPEASGEPNPAHIPVIPLDARPHVTFSRPVHDDAKVGVIVQPVTPAWEILGDPSKNEGPVLTRYSLKEIALQKKEAGSWVTVARKATTPNGAGVDTLFGSWAPVPAMPDGGGVNVGQTKLWLWSKTPYDYLRRTGADWRDWWANYFNDYPCIPVAPDSRTCCDFEDYNVGDRLPSPYICAGDPSITFTVDTHQVPWFTIAELDPPIEGKTRGACFVGFHGATIDFGAPVRNARILMHADGQKSSKECINLDAVTPDLGPNPRIVDGVTFKAWRPGPAAEANTEITSYQGGARVLFISKTLEITFPCPIDWVELKLITESSLTIETIDAFYQRTSTAVAASPSFQTVEISKSGTISILITADNDYTLNYLREICYNCFECASNSEGVNGICSDLSTATPDTASNPRIVNGVSFLAMNAESNPYESSQIVELSGGRALDLETNTKISFPQLTDGVALELVLNEAGTVKALNESDEVIATLHIAPDSSVQTVFVDVRNIKAITINSPTAQNYLRTVCRDSAVPSGTTAAYATDSDAVQTGPYVSNGSVIWLPVPNLEQVWVRSNGRPGAAQACFVEVCANLGPDPSEVTLREAMQQHNQDETARWADKGAVLEPSTEYRLRLQTEIQTKETGKQAVDDVPNTHAITEYAYFKTEGPPGLANYSLPVNQVADNFESGLSDLQRYVRQTLPATVPAAGKKTPLPRPIYRAYDVGADFNEDYVELMYRMAGRTLNLYLFDNNNQPVRDAQGRLIILNNAWGQAESLTLDAEEQNWINDLSIVNCDPATPNIDEATIPHDDRAAARNKDQVLKSDVFYEARLVPLLVHDDFREYTLGQTAIGSGTSIGPWSVEQQSGASGDSTWEIFEDGAGADATRYIGQTSGMGFTGPGSTAHRPGAMLIHTSSSNWDNYRYSLYLRSSDTDTIGVVFRYNGVNDYYQFHMDQQNGYRRLLRNKAGVVTVLAQDRVAYTSDRDYLVTVEAIGELLNVYLDGALLFSVQDSAFDKGGIGLYCSRNSDAQFRDIRVDDFREAAPVVYRFQFTTSNYANFIQHINSYRDSTWLNELLPATPYDGVISTFVSTANAPATAPTDLEQRKYAEFAEIVNGQDSLTNPPELQASRIERSGHAYALLLESPEPIDWARTDLDVLYAANPIESGVGAGAARIADVSFGNANMGSESVSLVLNSATNLNGYTLETYDPPSGGGIFEPPESDSVVFVVDHGSGSCGQLYHEDFGTNALDLYEIIDQAGASPGSNWQVAGGAIIQRNATFAGTEPDARGTIALIGSEQWTDYRVRLGLEVAASGASGLVFRYTDEENYYRFSINTNGSSGNRRLVKVSGGTVSVLWEDTQVMATSQSHELVIQVQGSNIVGSINNRYMFAVEDSSNFNGRVGFYSWKNTGAEFDELLVEELRAKLLLWNPEFNSLDDVVIVDEGSIDAPSEWLVSGGKLLQDGNIHGGTNNETDLPKPGTYAIAQTGSLRDTEIGLRFTADDVGALGVMFRYVDEDNYYRFSMDADPSRTYRHLVKKVNGVFTLLWKDPNNGFTVSQAHDLTITNVGSKIAVHLDGNLLCDVIDKDLDSGHVALYTWRKVVVQFENVIVTDPRRAVGAGMAIYDESNLSGRSIWTCYEKSLKQISAIGSSSGSEKTGTYAVTTGVAESDYRINATLQSDSAEDIGVVFRFVDEDNFYRLSFNVSGQYIKLLKKQNGSYSQIWSQTSQPGYVRYTAFKVRVDLVGNRIVAYVDDNKLFDLNDSTHSQGQAGLYCAENTKAYFDEFVVRRMPLSTYALFADKFASKDASEWTVVDDGTYETPSNWAFNNGAYEQSRNVHDDPSAGLAIHKRGTFAVAGSSDWDDLVFKTVLRSNDVNSIGVMFRYTDSKNYYRFSMDKQRQFRRLIKNVNGVMTELWADEFEYEHREYEFTVVLEGRLIRVFMDGAQVLEFDDSSHPQGKVGLYCWRNTAARFVRAQVYPLEMLTQQYTLRDEFDVLNVNRWKFYDDGTLNTPSDWSVASGELRQQSDINGNTANDAFLGTYALAGESSWTDYRLTTRLKSADDGSIGVMFRYIDEDNYYRFSMNKLQTFRRLTKKENGQTTTLWEDTQSGFNTQDEYFVTIDCVGNILTGMLNGAELFSVKDTTHAAGKIALYCCQNTGAQFMEMSVAEMVWRNHYTFTGEVARPAGTVIQVFGATPTASPDACVEARVIAQKDDSPVDRFGGKSVTLRLRNASDLIHSRQFLNEELFASVANVKLNRKVDGTAFLLFIDSAHASSTTITQGTYKLKFVYRRDNRANDPNSELLSRDGDTSSEKAEIVIPW